jgi:hypothetical protein
VGVGKISQGRTWFILSSSNMQLLGNVWSTGRPHHSIPHLLQPFTKYRVPETDVKRLDVCPSIAKICQSTDPTHATVGASVVGAAVGACVVGAWHVSHESHLVPPKVPSLQASLPSQQYLALELVGLNLKLPEQAPSPLQIKMTLLAAVFILALPSHAFVPSQLKMQVVASQRSPMFRSSLHLSVP